MKTINISEKCAGFYCMAIIWMAMTLGNLAPKTKLFGLHRNAGDEGVPQHGTTPWPLCGMEY